MERFTVPVAGSQYGSDRYSSMHESLASMPIEEPSSGAWISPYLIDTAKLSCSTALLFELEGWRNVKISDGNTGWKIVAVVITELIAFAGVASLPKLASLKI